MSHAAFFDELNQLETESFRNSLVNFIGRRCPKEISLYQFHFECDWNRVPTPEMEDVGLVISPDNVRVKLEDFIGSAKKSIHILQQGFSTMKASSVQIEHLSFESTSNNFIEIDREKAYVGSNSLSRDTMDQTRGFGSIDTSQEMVNIGHNVRHFQ